MVAPVSRWLRLIPGTFWAQFRLLVKANAIAYVVALSVAPLLVLLYTPADFGAYGLFAAVLSLSVAIGGVRYETAILSAQSLQDAREVGALAFLSAIIVACGASGVLAVLSEIAIGGELLPWWTPLALFLTSVVSVAYVICRYANYFLENSRAVARGVVAQATGRAGSQLLLGLASPTAGALVMGEAIGRTIALAPVVSAAMPFLRGPRVPIRRLVAVARSRSEYVVFALPSSAIDATVQLAPLPVIAAIYGVHSAGLYVFVQRMMALPVGVLGQAVADTLHSHLATAERTGGAGTRKLFHHTARLLIAVGCILAALLVVGGYILFDVVADPRWDGAFEVVVVMAPVMALRFAVSPLSRVVFVLGGQRQKLAYDVTVLVAVSFVLAVSATFALGFLEALLLLSGAHVVGHVVYYAVLRTLVNRHDRLGSDGAASGDPLTDPSDTP
jgi:O-antigen/teichoic acid export membrane protein